MSTETAEAIVDPEAVGADAPADDPAEGEALEAADLVEALGSDFSAYDFRTPPEIGLPRQPEMEEVVAEFTAEFQPWLGARFREPVTISPKGLELAAFHDVRDRLVKPTACYLYTVREASDRFAMLVFGHDLAFAAVERMLGGKGSPVIPTRALSVLEQRVVGTVAKRFLADYLRNWKDHVALTLEPQGFESAPELLQIAGRDDRYFGVHLEIRGEDWTSDASLWLPAQAMDEYMAASPEQAVQTTVDPAIQRDHENIRATILTAQVKVGARLPRFRVPLGTLAQLKPGLVIPTRLSVVVPIELWVGGQPRFLGAAGRSDGQLAVRVLGPVDPTKSAVSTPSQGTER